MKLSGGVLPFIGWRVINVDNDGCPCDPPSHWQTNALELEWLGCGITICTGKVFPSNDNYRTD